MAYDSAQYSGSVQNNQFYTFGFLFLHVFSISWERKKCNEILPDFKFLCAVCCLLSADSILSNMEAFEVRKYLATTRLLLLVCCLFSACTTNKQKDEGPMKPYKETVPLSGGITFTGNSHGNRSLDGSPYGYEVWTEGGNDNKMIWYGPEQGGGAAFRVEWNNPNDYLGRLGYYWGNGGKYTDYKNIFVDFSYTRSGRSTAGNYSYIGIYGWTKNPLIEYYIVEDWFGNKWQEDTSPLTTNTTGGSVIGSFTVDGAVYNIVTNVREQKPSIEGTQTFTQYFSIRQTPRQSGTISVTEHFKKWEELGLPLGNMYEAKFLVEAGGGVGWFDASYLSFRQED